jgi:Flp pilus assembly protein TadG
MIIPLLVIATIATIEFGSVISLQQTVNQAAIEGARAAAKHQDINYVVSVVNGVLSQQGISIGANAAVRLENPPAADATSGTPSCPAPASPATVSAGNIRVTVCVPVSTTSVPIAGQLADLGFSLLGNSLRQSAVARKE